MLLAIDIGNSHTVTGLYNGAELVAQWRLQSDAKNTADELAIRYQTLFKTTKIDKEMIRGIIIAGVVPSLQVAWLDCCHRHFSSHLHHDPFVVSAANIRDMITIKLKNHKEIGVDRLVNAIAAYNLSNCKQVVIDFGTAITFDCITEKCEYLGGAILPGITVSLEVLSQWAAQLPYIDATDPPLSTIGKSTIQAMKSGIVYGYGAMVDGLVARMRGEMTQSPEEDFKVVATGGMSQHIAPYANAIDKVDPLLTVRGLQIIYNNFLRPQK